MSLFSIDLNRCQRDGICAMQCPARAIQYNGSGTVPFPADDAEKSCLKCGHCVAVCPQGAFYLDSVGPQESIPIERELLPTAKQVEHFLLSRRSIRNFKAQPVEKERIDSILRVANYAPSGHNTRPVHWLVIYDPEEVRYLSSMVIDWMRDTLEENPDLARQLSMEHVIATWDAGYDRISRSAPHIVIAHGNRAVSAARPACTIALSYLELAAYSHGLGACWAGFFGSASSSYPPLQQQLSLPDGHQCFGAMLLGYPQYQYRRIPPRESPKVTWLEGNHG